MAKVCGNFPKQDSEGDEIRERYIYGKKKKKKNL